MVGVNVIVDVSVCEGVYVLVGVRVAVLVEVDVEVEVAVLVREGVKVKYFAVSDRATLVLVIAVFSKYEQDESSSIKKL